MRHHAIQVYDYHVWANNNVFTRLKEVPPELITKEIPSVFPSISAAVAHIYSTDVLWLHVMRQIQFDDFVGKLMKLRDEAMGADLKRLEEMYAEIEGEYRAFFLEHPNLDETAVGVHPKFGKLETTLGEMVQHVVNHGTYHRGQVTAMLRQLGVPGASSDYATFLYTITS